MDPKRRSFLRHSLLASTGTAVLGSQLWKPSAGRDRSELGPVWSFDPVVGDGRWIWKEPPANDRGYLEPRTYSVRVGIELKAGSSPCEALASTPVPVEHPEQKIDDVTIETDGCEAALRDLAPGAGQLFVHAPEIGPGQIAKAVVNYTITLYKQYHAYAVEQFPTIQNVPMEIRALAVGDSPGIQSNAGNVRKLANEISKGLTHPWEKAESFVKWIRGNIHPKRGAYTSVLTAIKTRVGDCEEMSALFVAFCRASGIPARIVWVPNHNWAEFYLVDHDQQGHWIPVHPACYNWFGWTGVHELIIQKGDRIVVPEQSIPCRLMMDWLRANSSVKTTYVAEMHPTPSKEGEDPGPGGRVKDAKTGEWKLTGKHPMDRYARR